MKIRQVQNINQWTETAIDKLQKYCNNNNEKKSGMTVYQKDFVYEKMLKLGRTSPFSIS